MKRLKRFFTALLSVALVISMSVSVGNASTGPFTDVPEGAWFEEGVIACYDRGIIRGTSVDVFSPDKPITRAEFITMVFRAEMMARFKGIIHNKKAFGDSYLVPEPESFEAFFQSCSEEYLYCGDIGVFTDVDPNAYYAATVAWGQYEGYISGTTESLFSPDSEITREQAMTILYRYQQAEGLDLMYQNGLHEYVSDCAELYGFKTFGKEIIVNIGVLGNYIDGDAVSEFAYEAVAWAIQSDYINGTSPGVLAPQETVTRAQAATLFARMMNSIELAGAEKMRPI